MSLMPLYKNTMKIVSNKVLLLRKIRKFIDYGTALCIYKQTILPLFDYSRFLLLSLTKGQKNDFQTIQNDVLRFAKNIRINDRISKVELHKEAKLLSLERRHEKQLLSLMYKLSKKGLLRKVMNHITQHQEKHVFITDSKIRKKYEKSPYFIGTLSWDKLTSKVQESESIWEFKKNISELYKEYGDT